MKTLKEELKRQKETGWITQKQYEEGANVLKTQHTPTPLGKLLGKLKAKALPHINNEELRNIDREIVRAVNSHEELLEKLKWAKMALTMNRRPDKCYIDDLKRVIAKAEGK